MEYKTVTITNDADALLCVLYKSYLEKRKNGVPKDEAKMFGNHEVIQSELIPKWSQADVKSTIGELHEAGVINTVYGDGLPVFVELLPAGIIGMENRFENNLKTLLDYMAKIKAVIPFL